MPVASQSLDMVHDLDPREVIWEAVKGRIDAIEPMVNEIIVGVYMRPEKIALKGGGALFIPDKVRQEDQFQGIVAMVLKVGPMAFKDTADWQWGGRVPKEGDWIAFSVNDARSFLLGKHPCRYLKDSSVKMIVARPDVLL